MGYQEGQQNGIYELSLGDIALINAERINKLKASGLIKESNQMRGLTDFLPALNPAKKPATKNATSAKKVIQKIGVWIISNIWQLILLVIAGLLIAYLLVRFKIPH